MTPEEITKLGKEGSKAIGKLSELVKQSTLPNVTKRQTKALINDANKKAEFIRSNPDMKVSFEGDTVNIRQLLPSEIVERAELRMLSRAIRQQQNIEKVLDYAYNDLQYAEECSDDELNQDWWNRFENYAEDISIEEMQMIWGKILAGEIMKPNSFSLRTLETLKNISTEEAKIFQKICPLLIESGAILNVSKKTYEIADINYGQLLRLDNAGLIFSSGNIVLTKDVEDRKTTLVFKDYIIKIFFNEDLESINIPVYSLTETGMEISKIINCNTDIDSVIDLVTAFTKTRSNVVKFTCHKLTIIEGKQGYQVEPDYIYLNTSCNDELKHKDNSN